MVEREKLGYRVDARRKEEFKQFVEEKHGRTRGLLGRELEKAMLAWMDRESRQDQLDRIEEDLATLKARVAEAESDGGTVAPPLPESEPDRARAAAPDGPDEDPGARTAGDAERDGPAAGPDGDDGDTTDPSERVLLPGENRTVALDAERPRPNAPREPKVDYLALCVVKEQATPTSPGEVGISRERLLAMIQSEYDFTERVAENYIGRIVDALDLRPHPRPSVGDDILLGPSAYRVQVDRLREEAEEESDE